MRSPEEIDSILGLLPFDWRWRWCIAEECGCLGGVNCSGRSILVQKNIDPPTYEEWADFVRRHPDPRPQPRVEISREDFYSFKDINGG